jgi:hypothetical protein
LNGSDPGGKAFGVEHALVLYATNFVAMSATAIYEDDAIRMYLDQIAKCHIYLIGLPPTVEMVDLKQDDDDLVAVFDVANARCEVRCSLPPGATIVRDGEGELYIVDRDSRKPASEIMLKGLRQEYQDIDFKVLYIGQAFGVEGSRNALDRLKQHETLQKISVKGIPEGYTLTILMLVVDSGHDLVTVISPFPGDRAKDLERMEAAMTFNTTEAERITIYEAALIRYFQPPFNKEFKSSFPSTNLKLLAECYSKDFSAVVAEICLESLPFRIFSDAVEHKGYHIAKHDLHSAKDRQLFFFG